MRGKERIPLADIIQTYIPRSSNIDPAYLHNSVIDLHTLVRYTHSSFPKTATELRKKITIREKAFKTVKDTAEQIPFLFQNQPKSNFHLASNIVKLCSPSVIEKKQQRSVIKEELKIKFLQSKGIDINEWQHFFKFQLGVLAITVPDIDAKVILGLAQAKQQGLQWKIMGCFIGDEPNLDFYDFVTIYLEWSRKYNEYWQEDLILGIKKILQNIALVEIYLGLMNLYRSTNKQEISEEGNLKVECESKDLKWQWTFFLFGNTSKQIQLSIDKKRAIRIIFQRNTTKSELFLQSEQNDQFVFKTNRSQYFTFEQLVTFPSKYNRLKASLVNLYNKGANFLKNPIFFFARTLQTSWIQAEEDIKEYSEIEQDGLWILIQTEQNCFLKVEEDGTIKSRIMNSTLLNEFIDKQIDLVSLAKHLLLYKHIKEKNDEFQFKIYSTKLESFSDPEEENILVYEFRSDRFVTNQKYPQKKKNQELFSNTESNSYENCVLLVKVHLDFTKASFRSYKIAEGSEHQSDRSLFLTPSWLNYYNNLNGQKMDCLQLAQAVGFYCRCYLIQRIKKRVFSEEMLKANSIELK